MRWGNMLNCPVDTARLRTLQVSYIGFDGVERDDGEIMVLDVAEKYVKNIF